MTLILPQLYMPQRGAVGGGIAYVGGTTAAWPGASSGTETVSLTALTGGIATAPAAGDFVLFFYGIEVTGTGAIPATAGYTEFADISANDSYDALLRVGYKFMGGTPDVSLVVPATQNAANAGAVVVHVFRGVDPTTPIDIASQTSSAINTVLPDPPASGIPTVSGAWAVVGGAGAHVQGVQTFSSSDLTDFLSVVGNDSRDITVGAGYAVTGGGSFDAAAFEFSGNNLSSSSAVSRVVVLRPA